MNIITNVKKGDVSVEISQRLSISYYKVVATINEPHKIYLVQHQETGKFFVKKILDVYSIDVYRYLREHPIQGIPQVIDFYEDNSTLTLIEEYFKRNNRVPVSILRADRALHDQLM